MDKVVKASPTKEFFVNMLVRDILLKQAIIELIDNSIDGARSMREENQYFGLKISVTFDKDKFVIEDNCGGIPVDIAANYAFRFGRPKTVQSGNAATTGIFTMPIRAADSWFSHLAVEVPGEEASNEWLEPVIDEQYLKATDKEA